MPSSIAHGLAAAALTAVAYGGPAPRRLLIAAAACAVLPDLDAAGRPFGRGDVAWLGGHRAVTHSLAFAALLALAAVGAWFRGPAMRGRRARAWGCLAAGTALHGGLDALTTYGEGVALFAPVSDLRVKAPWLPLSGVLPEVVAVWLPAAVLLWRARRRARVT